MAERLRLYGLEVASEVPLHQGRPAEPGVVPDVRLAAGPEVQGPHPAEAGERLLEYARDGEPLYYALAAPDGRHRLVFARSCEFEVSPDLGRAVVRRYPGAVPGIESVLGAGAFLAWQLQMRGHLVLHASAVEVDGRALAFVGNPGMGKSTMATLMCADGARLVTDDVLRVDDVETAPVARLGASGVRLRKGADTLSDRFPDERVARRTSADARQVLTPVGDPADRLPLSAIVVPCPDRTISAVEVERVPARQALFLLLGFPRLLGWRDPSLLQRQFQQVGELVSRVPVLVARIPWVSRSPTTSPSRSGSRRWEAARPWSPPGDTRRPPLAPVSRRSGTLTP